MTFKNKGSWDGPDSAGALQARGPFITITAKPTPSNQMLLAAANLPCNSVDVTLLIDSGARRTCLDESVIKTLYIKPVGMIPITGVSGQSEMRPLFQMSFDIPMTDDATGKVRTGNFETVVAGIAPVATASKLKCHGLLGRDFLQFFRFNYSGPAGTWELIESAPADAEKKPTKKRHSRYTGH